MIPVMIPTPGGDCFAAYNWAPGPAVLICPPFGYEAQATARGFRQLARSLAALGMAALRLDLPGTGDSAGDPLAPGQVAAWRAAIDHAASWLSARHDGRVALLGHRFGALLALDAVARGTAAHRLVLLDPPPSGAAFGRGLRARARLEGHGLTGAKSGLLQAWETIATPETLADLATLPQPFSPGTTMPQTLLVLDEGTGSASAWPGQLREAGAQVTTTPFDGYADFVLARPLKVVPPTAVLRRVADFLTAGEASAVGPSSQPPEAMAMRLPGLSERGLHFDPHGNLFGILCLPDRQADAPAILLPSVGDRPRSGNGRAWTDLARRLARHGIASLRFDVAGVGDSKDSAQPDQLVASYHPDRITDFRAALDALQEHGLTSAVVIGLCSGAYLGWNAAAADRRIVGALAINAQYIVADRLLSRAALEGASVRAELSMFAAHLRSQRAGTAHGAAHGGGAVHLARRVAAAVGWRLATALGMATREARRARAQLAALLARGVAVEFLFASDDAGLRSFGRAFGTPPSLPAAVPVTLFDGADHVFGAAPHRAWLLDFTTRFALQFASIAHHALAVPVPSEEITP
jgi:alpha/beta superfamily hydrolase